MRRQTVEIVEESKNIIANRIPNKKRRDKLRKKYRNALPEHSL